MPLSLVFGGFAKPPGGAHNRIRTDDLFLTKEVLCRLSYVGPDLFALISGGQGGNRTPTVEDG